MQRVNPTLQFSEGFGPGPSVKTQLLNDANIFDAVHVFKIYFNVIGVRCTKANGQILGGFNTICTTMGEKNESSYHIVKSLTKICWLLILLYS